MSAVSETAAPAARIDWRQVRALVRAFVLMSVRSLPLRTMRGERGGSGLRGLFFIVGIYALLGCGLATLAAVVKDVLVYSFTVHLLTLFVIGSSALNEASEVLFSSSENDVLLHRPIPPATLVLAKGLTIVAFTLMLGGAINLAPTFVMLALDGARPIIPLVHMFSVLVSTIFASAVVLSVYGLVARVLGRERFQRVITVVQIGSTIFLVMGFQIVPRLFANQHGQDFATFVRESKLAWLMPPLWFASLDAWLGARAPTAVYTGLALAGLGVTAVCAWIGVLRLPATGNNVASLGEEPRKEIAQAANFTSDTGRIERLLAPWLRHPLERAVFALTKAHLVRERQIKVRLAGALAFYLVFPLLAFFDDSNQQFLPLMVCWMTTMIPITTLELLRIGSQPAAADLFAYSPIARPEQIFHGVRKASMVFVQAPIVLYVLLVCGFALRADLGKLLTALPALLLIPPMSLVPGVLGEYLPFSVATRTGQRTLQSFLVLLAMLPAGILGVASYFAYQAGYLWILIAVLTPVAIGVHIAMRHVVALRTQRPRTQTREPEPGWGSGGAAAS